LPGLALQAHDLRRTGICGLQRQLVVFGVAEPGERLNRIDLVGKRSDMPTGHAGRAGRHSVREQAMVPLCGQQPL
jgi:hypothetical protein